MKFQSGKDKAISQVFVKTRIHLMSRPSLFPSHQAGYKTHYGHDGENKKQDFRDFNGTGRNTAKTKKGSDQGDHKKNNRVMQHDVLRDGGWGTGAMVETLSLYMRLG